jgi:hypothetical protein
MAPAPTPTAGRPFVVEHHRQPHTPLGGPRSHDRRLADAHYLSNNPACMAAGATPAIRTCMRGGEPRTLHEAHKRPGGSASNVDGMGALRYTGMSPASRLVPRPI